MTVKDYLESWLETERLKVKHSTSAEYQKIFKYHLVPSFGTLKVSELRNIFTIGRTNIRKCQ